MTNDLVWLKQVEQYLLGNGGGDLYCLLEIMYIEKKLNFRQFIFDASRGFGCVVSEGLEYVLDNDIDDPNEFDSVTFIIGDHESSTLHPQKFVELMQVVSDSYIREYPRDKEFINQSMNMLKKRYQHFYCGE